MEAQVCPFGLSDEGPIEEGLKPSPELDDLPGEFCGKQQAQE
jgi:hypothetical protein